MLGAQAANTGWEGLIVIFASVVLVLAVWFARMLNR
jgi:hypothetical protein